MLQAIVRVVVHTCSWIKTFAIYTFSLQGVQEEAQPSFAIVAIHFYFRFLCLSK